VAEVVARAMPIHAKYKTGIALKNEDECHAMLQYCTPRPDSRRGQLSSPRAHGRSEVQAPDGVDLEKDLARRPEEAPLPTGKALKFLDDSHVEHGAALDVCASEPGSGAGLAGSTAGPSLQVYPIRIREGDSTPAQCKY